jgi:ParB-like nuclease domain
VLLLTPWVKAKDRAELGRHDEETECIAQISQAGAARNYENSQRGASMKHIKVKIGDLRPNPFRKEILGGKVDEDKIARLEESFDKSGKPGEPDFWNGLRGRPANGRITDYKSGDKIELAFGEHRRQAALRKLGKDFEVWIDFDDFTDEQMLIMLANENAVSSGASDGEQIDTAGLVHRWLEKNYKKDQRCPYLTGRLSLSQPVASHGRANGGAEEQHVHGSTQCITAFLGDKNWSLAKVKRLFSLAGLHDDVKAITSFGGDRVTRKGTAPGTVSYQSAGALAPLSKPVQVVAAAEIKKAPVGLPAPLIKQAVKVVIAEAPKAAQPEQKREVERVVKPLELGRLDAQRCHQRR